MSAGMEQLQACMLTILAEVKELRVEVSSFAKASEDTKAAPSRGQEVDATRPLTAKELCVRWNIGAGTPELQLTYLARRCRHYGLEALKGADGWKALYRRADVVRAEEHAAGKVRGRKVTRPSRKATEGRGPSNTRGRAVVA